MSSLSHSQYGRSIGVMSGISRVGTIGENAMQCSVYHAVAQHTPYMVLNVDRLVVRDQTGISLMSDISRGRHNNRNNARCLAYHAVGTTGGMILDVRHITLSAQQAECSSMSA